VVLAGGLGTRLRDTIADKQKVIADVSGRPFLEYVLDQVAENGFTRTTLCIGYMAHQVEEHFGAQYNGLELTYSREHALLGTAGALRFALPQLKSKTILVLNGDSFCQTDLKKFLAFHEHRQAKASVLLTRMEDTKRYGRVNIDESDRLTSFEEKGVQHCAGWINAGIYLLNAELIKVLPLGRNISLERDVFPDWVGKNFFGYCQPNTTFIDIGTANSYREAQRLFSGDDA